ncbi:hypothetical protein M501DRAFT_1031314 [Patellaria atrata CBS 101060]|uniref:RNase H type-1 domain-containing protein n=1 Tax=Patellaria atrata CBS 101060 TaxID=1346257 RepID=A0A9P4SAY9_9PEZI|nr:hypothetical protein M501DRAFT_1031314 [Patellaria atrata CBS 101060]
MLPAGQQTNKRSLGNDESRGNKKLRTNLQRGGVVPQPSTESTGVPTEFPGSIVIKPREEAKAAGLRESQRAIVPERLVFWADGSVQGEGYKTAGGAAVVYKTPASSEWQKSEVYGFQVGHGESTAAELEGIARALEIAGSLSGPHIQQVVVLTDSLHGVRGIGGLLKKPLSEPLSEIVQKIRRLAKKLSDLKIAIELRWIPGHCIGGNNKADTVAKRAAGKMRELRRLMGPEEPEEGEIEEIPVQSNNRTRKKGKKRSRITPVSTRKHQLSSFINGISRGLWYLNHILISARDGFYSKGRMWYENREECPQTERRSDLTSIKKTSISNET